MIEAVPAPTGEEDPARPVADPARLPLSTLLSYSAPMLGIGFMELLAGMYLMKYSTDVLAIPPAAMGAVFLVSRVWSAVADPVAGFLSDRTRTGLGRRRPWMLAAALPLGIVFLLVWSPPALRPEGLTLWMGAMVVLLYTVLTVFNMPYDALGAELSTDYHDRTRIFAVRRVVFGVGAALVLAAVARLAASGAPRRDAFAIAALAGGVTAALVVYTSLVLHERPEYQGRGATHPGAALRDVWANPHARLLLAVFGLQQIAVGTVTVMAAYHAEYVLGLPGALPIMLGSFFAVSVLSVPVWVALGRRVEKKRLLVASMLFAAVSMGAIFFVGEGDAALLVALAGLGGLSSGGGDVVFPSLQADVIDYDEYRTGQRKEGVYFAAWHFAAKTATGLAHLVTGVVLSTSGFLPNQAQDESALFAIRTLMSLFPLFCYGAGVLFFLRFGLDRRAHDGIRVALAARGGAAGSPALPTAPEP
jgi:GPH family glycoside/pentoside/hexuronide:cation symporter